MTERILMVSVVAIAGVFLGVMLQNLVIYATHREPLFVDLAIWQMAGATGAALAAMLFAGFILSRSAAQ